MVYYYLRYHGQHPYSIVKASTATEIRKKAYNDLKSTKYKDKSYEIWYYKGKDVLLYEPSAVVYDPRYDGMIDDKPVGEIYSTKYGIMYDQYKGDYILPGKRVLTDGSLFKE